MKKIRLGMTALLFLSFISSLPATDEYAEKTGKDCTFCHLDSSGGGELTQAGEAYLQFLFSEPESEETGSSLVDGRGFRHYLRLVLGFIHIFTAIFWFGTILYVHIILKPAYAAHGLPRGEVRLGLFSIVIMAVTGTALTLFRVPSFSFFLETRFGLLLLIKIAIFLIMVLTALFVVIFIGPKLKRTRQPEYFDHLKPPSLQDLDQFDGKEGRPASVVYKGHIYDVTESEHWLDGIHFGRHKAGKDLTGMLNQAPHGEDKVLAMPQLGVVKGAEAKKKSIPETRIFYILAYINLGFVILITLILALWKWW